jgi:uncharacterized protein
MNKKTAIIGATTNPERYAYLAAERLTSHGHEIVPIGIKKGEVFSKSILSLQDRPGVEDLDTITLYLNPQNQVEWETYLLSLRPKRIIFNPGTENPSFAAKAQKQGIETVEGCTLVMLSVGNF